MYNWNTSFKGGTAPTNASSGGFREQVPRSGSYQAPAFSNQMFTQNFGNGNNAVQNHPFQQFSMTQSFGSQFSSQERNPTFQSGNLGGSKNNPFGNFQNRQQSQIFDNNQRVGTTGGSWEPGNNSSGFQIDSFQSRHRFDATAQADVPRFERNQYQNSSSGPPNLSRAEATPKKFVHSGDSYAASSSQLHRTKSSRSSSQPQQTENAVDPMFPQDSRTLNAVPQLPRQAENAPIEPVTNSDKRDSEQDTIFNKVGNVAQSEGIPGLGEILTTDQKASLGEEVSSSQPKISNNKKATKENHVVITEENETAVEVRNEADSKNEEVQSDGCVMERAATGDIKREKLQDEGSEKPTSVENYIQEKEKVGEAEIVNFEKIANEVNDEMTREDTNGGETVKAKALSHSKAATKSQVYDLKTLQDFDKKFAEWEKQFEAWKLANANHKDRDAYDRYIDQFTHWGNTLAKQREFILHEIEKQKIRDEMEKASLEKAAKEKAAMEKAIMEKTAMEKAVIEKVVMEKAAMENAAIEKAAIEKAAMEKANLVDQSRFPIKSDQEQHNFPRPIGARGAGASMHGAEQVSMGLLPGHVETEHNVNNKRMSQTFDLNSVPDSLLSAIAKTLGNSSGVSDESKNNLMQTAVPFANLGDVRQQQQPPQPLGPNPFDIRHNMDMNRPFNNALNPFETALLCDPRFGTLPTTPTRIPRVSVFDDDRIRPPHPNMYQSFNNEHGSSRMRFDNKEQFNENISAGNRVNPFQTPNATLFPINQLQATPFQIRNANTFPIDELRQENPFSSHFSAENPWDSQSNRMSLQQTSANSFKACSSNNLPFHPPPALSNPRAANEFNKEETVKPHTIGDVEFVRIKRVRDLPVATDVLIEDDTDASLEVIDYGHGSSATEVPDVVDDISRYVEREAMDSFDDCRRPKGREDSVTIDYGHGSAEDSNQHWSGRQYQESPPYPMHPRDYYDGPHGGRRHFDPNEDRHYRVMPREDDTAFVRPKRRFGLPERIEGNYSAREYELGRHRSPPPVRKHPTPPPGRVAPPRPNHPLSPELILSDSDLDSLPEVVEVIPSSVDVKAVNDKNRRVKVAPPRDLANPKSGGKSQDPDRQPSDRNRRRGPGREREKENSRERHEKETDRDKVRQREREKDKGRSSSRRSEQENDDKRSSWFRDKSPRRDNLSRSPARSKNRDSLPSDLARADASRSNTDGSTAATDQTGSTPTEPARAQTVLIEDILSVTGRKRRPAQIVIILRGLPGSGKSYVSKLIKDREIELGGSAPRILSLDDYFMTDEVEKTIKDPVTGKDFKETVTEYEYDALSEPSYRADLIKTFKKTVDGGFFPVIIVDSVNEKLKHFEEMAMFASKRRFQVYIAEMNETVEDCVKRNIHNRRKEEILALHRDWEATPMSYVKLDVRTLLQDEAVEDVEMEDVYDTKPAAEIKCVAVQESQDLVVEEEKEKPSDDPSGSAVSKWEKVDPSEEKLNKLDGLVRKRKAEEEDLKEMSSIESWLQRNLPDDYSNRTEARVGQKRVRWADIEERREQERMRDIGFVVGHTDWNRMTDPTFGSSALTKTKFI